MRLPDLQTDLTAILGVAGGSADGERARVIVSFVDGSKATIERNPSGVFARRDFYAVSLSGQRQAAHNVALVGRPRAKVIEQLSKLATRVAAAT